MKKLMSLLVGAALIAALVIAQEAPVVEETVVPEQTVQTVSQLHSITLRWDPPITNEVWSLPAVQAWAVTTNQPTLVQAEFKITKSVNGVVESTRFTTYDVTWFFKTNQGTWYRDFWRQTEGLKQRANTAKKRTQQ